MKKVVLYKSDDLSLKSFETKYGRSLIDKRYVLIERPLMMSEFAMTIAFADETGDGFVLTPTSVKKQMIKFMNPNGDFVSRMGIIIEANDHTYTFYYMQS